ncbi:acyl-CoA dehydrogenase family protein [Myxococcota bacterium]|nr:acyl-CoA dehydrogenase family protein [Myxococcota bacterium]MBU1432702.1 acyl-CoA dehydrogenase family protein [Myxococcota bacterium]
MAHFFKDNEDLRFYLERGIDWAPLIEELENGFQSKEVFKSVEEVVEFYRDILENVGEFAANEVAPYAAEMDRLGLEMLDGDVVLNAPFEKIFKKIKRLDLHGMCMPRELGGMNCPALMYFLVSELFARADVSVTTHLGFHGGIAVTLLQTSMSEGTTEFDPKTRALLKTRFADEIKELISGKAWGAMDLTEPNAGSDLAALRTKGEQDEAGNWFLTGQKIFLTSGSGKHHIVIARTEPNEGKTAGLAGLSLFHAPIYTEKRKKKEWLATIDRLEEKIGHHTSPTVSVTFERTPAQLIGQRGEGFRLMLLLMNHARMGVTFEGLGVCEAALRLSKEYAAERPSMGKTIDRHEMIAAYLDQMENEIIGLRAIGVTATWAEDMALAYKRACDFFTDKGSDEHKRYKRGYKKYKALARRLTPLCKYYGSERAVAHSRLAIQILGGVGYTREYGAEKLLRDALVLPIYEGTSQIQALMAMKDTLGAITKNPQAFIKRIAQARWTSLSARDPLERRVAKLQSLSLSAQQHLMQKTVASKFKSVGEKPIADWPKALKQNWDPKRDFSYAMLHAEHLIQLLINEAIAEILLDQALKHEDRREHLEVWLDRVEPECRYLLDKMHGGERILARLEAQAEQVEG